MTNPTNLDECFEELKKLLPFEDQVAIIQMEKGPVGLHHSLGRWLRNNWGLWQEDSVLHLYFKKLGLWHADDMSGLILDGFWCHLRNEPFDIDKQIKSYQDYWEKQKEKEAQKWFKSEYQKK